MQTLISTNTDPRLWVPRNTMNRAADAHTSRLKKLRNGATRQEKRRQQLLSPLVSLSISLSLLFRHWDTPGSTHTVDPHTRHTAQQHTLCPSPSVGPRVCVCVCVMHALTHTSHSSTVTMSPLSSRNAPSTRTVTASARPLVHPSCPTSTSSRLSPKKRTVSLSQCCAYVPLLVFDVCPHVCACVMHALTHTVTRRP
jgi:hypothetical protein